MSSLLSPLMSPSASGPTHSLLAGISGPEELRALPASDLPRLAAEIRRELVQTVTRTGGHLGPNLGVVELTIALHRVLHSPQDALVWDTGHQSYVHKLLTGRQAAFAGLRQAGGMSGYPNRAESAHDLVENSHASTALSYAYGLACAFALRGEHDRTVVAVVGDGALTGGMAWEGLNNLGRHRDLPVVVVLNDNGRSYAPTAGGLADHLAALRAGTGMPAVFPSLGVGYLGPVDGHDVAAIEAALRTARGRRTPTVVHCVTQKGRGYPAAERDERDRMHTIAAVPGGPTATGSDWTDVFGAELADLARRRPDVVAVTAAMLHPTGLTAMASETPDRVHDVGIAEQHALTSAAGLAMGGLHPVVALYATFLNRAFDQLLMDVALHRLPVTLVLDRAGVTGSDGATHNGMWDLSLLGMVPGLRVGAPRDTGTLRRLLAEALAYEDGPTALRFPKGKVCPPLPAMGRWGRADVLVQEHPDSPETVLLVVVGAMAGTAVAAAAELERAGIAMTVVDPGWVLPIDAALVDAAAGSRLVVTLEDNGLAGGYGDAFSRALRAAGVDSPLRALGLPQRFLPHGSRGDLLAEANLDIAGVVRSVREALLGISHRSAPSTDVRGLVGGGQDSRRAIAR
jgi:1-deoxy-D-xylulose-5-phosphate synthase